MAAEGTFILADIGGYTEFLTGVGIEHGKEITSHLLNSLLKCNRGRWKLANIEGDCLFLYREGREPPSSGALAQRLFEAISAEGDLVRE